MNILPTKDMKKDQLIKYCDFYHLSKTKRLNNKTVILRKEELYSIIVNWMKKHTVITKLLCNKQYIHLYSLKEHLYIDKNTNFIWTLYEPNKWWVIGVYQDEMILSLTKTHINFCNTRKWKCKIPDSFDEDNYTQPSYRSKRILELLEM